MRWRTVDDGESALFGVDELFASERSSGRMSDLEFLHVTAKRILNHVPSGSRAPTNWTINVYRGCSHACAYCLSGETQILLADGRTRPLSDIKVGDRIYGTADDGTVDDRTGRRLVHAEVLDHWRTTRAAWQVTVDHGRTIVASAEHRLLTDRGWARVDQLEQGHTLLGLTPDDLVQTRRTRAASLHKIAPLRVMATRQLGIEMPMYDITTTTGDFLADGIISHNCFARPTHEYLGLNLGEDFDRRIVVKINAVERVRAELADPRWRGEAVAMGTNTDPYQRAEGKYRLTRGVIEALGERGNPFSILTKSPLVTRDLDLITDAGRKAAVSVNFSIGTLDERVWRATEPGTPNPRRRIAAMAALSAAGVRTGALVAPVLPGLSDSAEQLSEVVGAIRGAGGSLLGISPLYLRPGVREHFLEWLAGFDAGLHADYLRRYAHGAYAPERYTDMLYARAGVARRSGSSAPRRESSNLDTSPGTAR